MAGSGEGPATIRSYQRIFRPERRIYQIQGRPLPVPGGVPLRWLGYAVATLLAVILVSSQSAMVALLAAAAAGGAGFVWGGRIGAVVAAAGALVAVPVSGWFVGALDWPLRLVILPALVATLATQATPDGRAAHRYATAWLRVRLDSGRRSLGRPLPAAGMARSARFGVWIRPLRGLGRPGRTLTVASPRSGARTGAGALSRAGVGAKTAPRPVARAPAGKGAQAAALGGDRLARTRGGSAP